MSVRDKKRWQAVQKMLADTGDRLFEKCHWCACVIIWWQKLPKESIIEGKNADGCLNVHDKVTFQIGKERKTYPIVTIDHVKELANGGNNYYKNLVLSCQKCNSSRSNPPKNIYTKCDECGILRNPSRKRLCKKCRAVNWLRFSPDAKKHFENNSIGTFGDIMKGKDLKSAKS